jgi:hypothetical protein
MTMYRRWTLPLVLASGAVIGAALTLRRRTAHHDAKKRQHTEDLQTWEGEGGNLVTPATPATAQHGP